MIGVTGLLTLILLLVLARTARRFDIGPQWLKRFVIEKHTWF